MSRLGFTAPSSIPGYDYGTPKSSISPVSESDMSRLEQSAGWTAADAGVLARHADLFRIKAESMVDSWRAVIGSQPHLSQWFARPDGAPDDDYKASVKRRFVQWIIDVALRPHDRDWLDYQTRDRTSSHAGEEERDGCRPDTVPRPVPISPQLYSRGSSGPRVLRRRHSG